MKLKKKIDQIWILQSFLEEVNEIPMGRDKETKCRKDHPWTAPPGDPSHIQSPNSDTVVDANKCLQKGA